MATTFRTDTELDLIKSIDERVEHYQKMVEIATLYKKGEKFPTENDWWSKQLMELITCRENAGLTGVVILKFVRSFLAGLKNRRSLYEDVAKSFREDIKYIKENNFKVGDRICLKRSAPYYQPKYPNGEVLIIGRIEIHRNKQRVIIYTNEEGKKEKSEDLFFYGKFSNQIEGVILKYYQKIYKNAEVL
jgi:hypothetical protein